MKTRFRAAMLASACSFVFIAIAAAAPIWTVPGLYTPDEAAAGTTRTFYISGPVWQRPDKLIERSPFSQRNMIRAAVVASVVLGVWLLAYRAAVPRGRPDLVGDYKEKLGKSVPDGRASSEQQDPKGDATGIASLEPLR